MVDGMDVRRKTGDASPASRGYLPTLDGWRAVAILAVIFHHAALFEWGPLSTRGLYEFGDTGVQVFFAISGILICTRLLEEEVKTGSLHLKGFYLRRILRIQPAALLFLLVALLLKFLAIAPLTWGEFFASLVSVRNYLHPWTTLPADWVTRHFWSLSVEEHFYLVLPVFLLLVRRRRATLLLGTAFFFLAWGAVAARAGLVGPQGYHRTDLCLPALLVPAALAVLLRRDGFLLALKNICGRQLAFCLRSLSLSPSGITGGTPCTVWPTWPLLPWFSVPCCILRA